MKFPGEICTKELQALFDCLKKWEHDNLPCADLNRDYVDCVSRAYKANKELAAAVKKVKYFMQILFIIITFTRKLSQSLTGFTFRMSLHS